MIKKAILPVAGVGTRFLPVTKSSPKEMLAIVDKPVIHYIVKEAVDSGIEEIIFVTGRGKRAIEDYFDTDPELNRNLELKRKDKELKELKYLENFAKISYVRQPHPLGDGHAILCAEHCVSPNEDFAVLFGDDIIDHHTPALRQLLNIYEKMQCPVIGVQDIQGKEIESYGVAGFSKEVNKGTYLINALQEKPKFADAVSSLGVIGKYVCTYEVFKAICAGSKSVGGELRLIDGFNYMLKKEKDLYAKVIEGTRYDTGSKIGWLKANIAFGLKNPEMEKELREIIKTIK